MNNDFARMVSDYLVTDEARKARWKMVRDFVIGLACLVALLVAVGWPTKADASPIYAAEEGGIKIVLTDEDCKLPAVSNLQKRATWTEKGKTYEGCWGGHPAFPIVLAYFADKSVVAFPVQLFVPVTGV